MSINFSEINDTMDFTPIGIKGKFILFTKFKIDLFKR